jgi:tetratricopeptide (TPR) repeat protein
MDPKYADAQNNIGTIWYQRKKFGKAIRSYQKAIKLRTDMAVLYSNLGYAYFGEKKYEESIGAFRQALALDPQCFEHNSSRSGSLLQDRSVSDRGRFYFLLAKSFAQAGNIERSAGLFAQSQRGRLWRDERSKNRSGLRGHGDAAGNARDFATENG